MEAHQTADFCGMLKPQEEKPKLHSVTVKQKINSYFEAAVHVRSVKKSAYVLFEIFQTKNIFFA